MSARTSSNDGRQGFDSLPAELQQYIINRVLRSEDVESSAAALLLVSKAWSQMVQPDRCVLELHRRDAHSSKLVASASMLDAEVRGVPPELPDDEGTDDGQLTTAFSQWKHLRCLQLRRLRDLSCLASLRAASLRAFVLEGIVLDLDDVAALGAALHAATALEHLAVIDCGWDWDGEIHGWGLAGRLLAPLQRCCSLRALELRIPDCLELASLPQLTHFHWKHRETERSLGTSDLALGSSLASLTLQPYEWTFEYSASSVDCLARMLTGNSTVRSLELDVIELPEELGDALCSMTGVTRFVTKIDHPFYRHLDPGRLAQSSNAITERLTELRLLVMRRYTLLLPLRLTSLVLHFSEGQCSLQTFANVGHCRALRRLSLSCIDVARLQDHIHLCLHSDDPVMDWEDELEDDCCPSNWLLCDLRCWAAHAYVPALAVQFFCRYVVSPLSKLTELELMTDDFPSEADRAELQAAAACPISWNRVWRAVDSLSPDIVGVPERLRRRVRRAA